mgnify:CR=1 FL=1
MLARHVFMGPQLSLNALSPGHPGTRSGDPNATGCVRDGRPLHVQMGRMDLTPTRALSQDPIFPQATMEGHMGPVLGLRHVDISGNTVYVWCKDDHGDDMRLVQGVRIPLKRSVLARSVLVKHPD